MESQNSTASDSESDDTSQRPNRWNGPPSTWQSLTEQERGLAASLDQLRDQDLSIHLYNAHALKKRAAEKSRELQHIEISDGDVEDSQGWIPPKTWTAWPLPPDEVPREGEQVGPEDEEEPYTFKKREIGRPSRLLEEVIMGVTLKSAKERFESRPAAEKDWQEGDDIDAQDALDSGDPAADTIKSEPETQPQILVPVVSSDDARSRELLRPSIRHILSQLDELLMVLHHSRQTCHQYASQSEATSDDEVHTRASSRARDSSAGSKRSRGRPRNSTKEFADLASRPKVDVTVENQEHDEANILRPKTARRGRKKKQYPRLEGETTQQYQVRIARLQKKPLPSFAEPTATESPEPPSSPQERPTRKIPAKRMTLEELAVSRQRRLRPRDWSEIIGAAAIAGFPPDVIARVSQRCASLFGEGMTLWTQDEAPFGIEAEFETVFQPEEIPDIPLESSDDESDVNPSSWTSEVRKARPSLGQKTSSLCPIEDCPRQTQGFRNVYDLKRHLIRGHKMTKSEADEALDSDSEMDGAIHVDGFLKPLKNLRGLHGGESSRKRERNEEEEEDDDDDETSTSESEDQEIGSSNSGF